MTRPVVALVQARMGSTRFPGKMMAELAGFPILRWVLERTRRARGLDRTVLATSREPGDDTLAELARSLDIDVFRGAEDDVLGRFAGAARRFGAATVVRVCADNPLIDPDVIDAAIAAFEERRPDYAFNHAQHLDCRYADGFGAEVLGATLLFELDRAATDAAHREHVTSYVWDNAGRFDILTVDCRPEWDARGQPVRLDVDCPDDLETLCRLCRGFDFATPAADILARWRAGRAAADEPK